jgi:hypothetical protein
LGGRQGAEGQKAEAGHDRKIAACSPGSRQRRAANKEPDLAE